MTRPEFSHSYDLAPGDIPPWLEVREILTASPVELPVEEAVKPFRRLVRRARFRAVDSLQLWQRCCTIRPRTSAALARGQVRQLFRQDDAAAPRYIDTLPETWMESLARSKPRLMHCYDGALREHLLHNLGSLGQYRGIIILQFRETGHIAKMFGYLLIRFYFDLYSVLSPPHYVHFSRHRDWQPDRIQAVEAARIRKLIKRQREES